MRRRHLLATLFAGLLALLPLLDSLNVAAIAPATAAATVTPNPSQPPAETTELGQAIDTVLTRLSDNRLFDGVVLVAQDGEILLAKGYGLASIEWDTPHTIQSKFRIGSLTKSFVAIAIMQLVDSGKLRIDDSICLYVPRCPAAWQPVTLHHLMSHTAGITDPGSIPKYGAHPQDPTTFTEQIDFIREEPLLFTPGSQWRYANINYILLGEVVKQASGTSFVRYLKEHITDPLDMMDTGVDDNRKILAHRATGYASAYSLAEYLNLSRVGTAGAMYSTAEDLLRLDQALYGDELVSAEAKKQMFTPHADVTIPGYKGGSGYGWFIADVFGHTRIDNGGVINGFKTELHRFPEQKITVIVMSNHDDQEPFTIAESLEKIIFEAQ